MRPWLRLAGVSLLASTAFSSQHISAQAGKSPLAAYIAVPDAVVALTHVEVVDGTGAPAAADQTILLSGGRITTIGASGSVTIPTGARVLDETGRTAFPGLVGMHEHLYYTEPGNESLHSFLMGQAQQTAPRLYLAAGVTTGRTTGSVEPFADLSLKRLIDSGAEPGPDLDITGPYLDGPGTFLQQAIQVRDAKDAQASVNYWADQGATSFKAYMWVKPEVLKTAIDAAHARGLKLTGHLCSVSFPEAAAMGIDNLEHGMVEDSEFIPEHVSGDCNGRTGLENIAEHVEIDGPQVQALIHTLVEHHVAVTSTLAVFESFAPNRPPMAFLNRQRETMAPEAWASVLERRSASAEKSSASLWPAALKKEMAFERAFVAAGGLLLSGCDPTGYGAVLPGFGDQRNLELLVEAGFTPIEAIQIATHNGAKYLGREQQIGTLAVGRQADLVLVRGDAAKDISAIENVELVFKQGVGYDPAKLVNSTRGMVGIR